MNFVSALSIQVLISRNYLIQVSETNVYVFMEAYKHLLRDLERIVKVYKYLLKLSNLLIKVFKHIVIVY